MSPPRRPYLLICSAVTRLAAAIYVHSLEQGLADAARAAEFGADLVEFRVDTFVDDLDGVARLVGGSPLPCILTCRAAWEGGQFDGDEAQRIALFERMGQLPQGPAYLDVELKAYAESPAVAAAVDRVVGHADRAGVATPGLILSSHDFTRRPADLLQKIEAMAAAPACRVIKVAWHARSLRDNLEAFEVIGHGYKPTVALCMGEFGLPSRVLARKFGALLTFAALDDSPTSGTAPGQPSLRELKSLYRWDAIGRGTRVYGVIGYPVGHSMSPPIHNAGFDAVDHDGVYLPMPIPPEYEHFKATVGAWLDFEPLHFRGASVTIPHKENLLRFVAERGGRNEIEPLAERIGAANTLTVREDGSLYASNTDYAAALDAVCDGLSIGREELAGKRVAVIGAGGAARAIVAGFAACGARVTIYNRTPDRARQLAGAFAGEVAAAGLDALRDAASDVFINCTPIGMHPHVDATPMAGPVAAWGPGTVVFDTIYNPVETRLLREAKAAGCVTIPGTEMFVRQAAAQFELWTGRPAPLGVFRRVLRAHLGMKQ